MPPIVKTGTLGLRCVTALLLATSVTGVAGQLPVMAAEPTLRGGVEQNASGVNSGTLQGGVSQSTWKSIPPGAVLEMSVSTQMETSLSQEGEDFYGKINKDYTIDQQLVIPRGTVVHGKVAKVIAPKRAGRDGYIALQFDQLILPDGRELQITGDSETRESRGKRILKATGRVAGHLAGGGLLGVLVMAQSGGVPFIAASSGYNLMAAAGVGAAAGLGVALGTKGQHKAVNPGALLNIRLEDTLQLQPVRENLRVRPQDAVLPPGLQVNIMGTKIVKDAFGEPTLLQVSLDIQNRTLNTFTLFDIALVDEYDTTHYLTPYGDESISMTQKIPPHARLRGALTFHVDNPKLRHTLVFFKQYTRERIGSTPLQVEEDRVELSKTGRRS